MLINKLSPNNKKIFLGTAMWGWVTKKPEVFSLLDEYAEQGQQLIDHATNYPINGISKDHGIGLDWLSEWLTANPSNDIEVLVKIGSTNNLGSPDSDLSPERVETQYAQLKEKLGSSLKCVAIHWDNRTTANSENEIMATLETLNRITQSDDCRLGVSGIQPIEIYANFFQRNSIKPIVQVKENILSSDSRAYYAKYFIEADYIAYGVNLGGLRKGGSGKTQTLRGIQHPEWVVKSFQKALNNSLITPIPESFYDISMYLGYINPELSGIIIGPKNKSQLSKIMDFWDKMQRSENLLAYPDLKKLLTAGSPSS